MSVLAIFIWLGNVILDTSGHVCLKQVAIQHSHSNFQTRWRALLGSPLLWLGVGCFALEFVGWLVLVSLLSLAQSVLLSSANIISIALVGRWVFKERLNLMRSLGVLLITSGVVLVGVFA